MRRDEMGELLAAPIAGALGPMGWLVGGMVVGMLFAMR